MVGSLVWYTFMGHELPHLCNYLIQTLLLMEVQSNTLPLQHWWKVVLIVPDIIIHHSTNGTSIKSASPFRHCYVPGTDNSKFQMYSMFLHSGLQAENIPVHYGHSSLLRSCQDHTFEVRVLKNRTVTVRQHCQRLQKS